MCTGGGAGTVGEIYGRVRYMGRLSMITSKQTLFHSQVIFSCFFFYLFETHKCAHLYSGLNLQQMFNSLDINLIIWQGCRLLCIDNILFSLFR